MVKKSFFFTIFLFILTSCQPAEMVPQSLVGLAAYPLVQLSEAFEKNTDDFYEQGLKEKEKRSLEEEALNCQREGLPLTTEMEDILKKVNLENCTGCRPLQRPLCDDKSCTCSTICPDWCKRVCPESSEILIQSREMAIPFKENNLDVTNFKSDFGNVGIWGGYCNGITSFTKRMTALSKFKPNEKPKDKDGKIISDSEKLKEYYAEKLSSINKGEVTEIPGFNSLYELTKEPYMQSVTRDAIRDAWSESNFYNPFLMESWGVLTPISDEKFDQELSDIKKMIQMSGSAQVTLSRNEKSGKGKGHTVEIYHVFEEKMGDETFINACVNDANIKRSTYLTQDEWIQKGRPDSSTDGVYCPNMKILKRSKNGKSTYKRNIKLDQMDRRDTAKHIEALSENCAEERNCEL